MPKQIICPKCGNRGCIPAEEGFEIRGKYQGKSVVKCKKCNSGLFLGAFSGIFIGTPQIIEPELWERMDALWNKTFVEESDSDQSAKWVQKEYWSGLILNLSKDLHRIREQMYDFCLEEGEKLIAEKGINVKIINRKLGGRADHVIKAYQLLRVYGCLHKYINPDEGKGFSDILVHQISGEDLLIIDEFIKIIYGFESESDETEEQKKKNTTNWLLVGQDIAKYMLGYEQTLPPSAFDGLSAYIMSEVPKQSLPATVALGIANSCFIPSLTHLTLLSVAINFQDEEFANQLISTFGEKH